MRLMRRHGPLLLWMPLQRRVEAIASAYFAVPDGAGIDFSAPSGEPALAAPDSVSWQVFKNPLALFVGGIAAVLLELAEPRVRTGVWHATSFRKEPARRLRSTGLAAMVTVYGPRSGAEGMIAAINRRHATIQGVTPDGIAFSAAQPELLEWVHATACYGFLEAFHAYVRPLDAAQRDRFHAEGRASALLYGAVGAPASQHQCASMMQSMRGMLEPSPIIFEFLGVMQEAHLLPGPLRMAQGLLIRAAVELLPAWVRERLGLDRRWRLRPWEHRLLRHAGVFADRLLLRNCPPALACCRMGLPEDYLYRQTGQTNQP
ncbi:oxygenase MpaB family protein [Noviherbaspirillum soli]|uniref:oxygenase MpaB family protein n=1 Tax=Noviherbaspirillum soli TaxID=1064518 RepID=UPI001E2A9609|nr:oxygenase MpaB family protein [Noviherbaspirillum soli]